MKLNTSEGAIGIETMNDKIGVYTPRDGRDHILYTLPETGISILKAIPGVLEQRKGKNKCYFKI